MRSIVEKEEVFLYTPEANYSTPTPGAGLVGWLFNAIGEQIDKSITESRREAAVASLDPLLAATADVDFRYDFWSALKPTLATSPWLKVSRLDTADDFIQPGNKLLVAEHEYADENFLAMSTNYNLTEDATELVVHTYAVYYIAGASSPVYKATVSSYSEAMEGEDKEAIIAGWAADGTAAYRKALQQGIDENMRMLQIDFLEARREDGGYNLSNYQPRSAVVERKGDRMIYRKKNGNLMAFPAKILAKIKAAEEQ